MTTLQQCFSSWSAPALAETLTCANKLVARYGNVRAARNSIAELSGGNVSLQCRAHFGPIDQVLAALENGATT